MPASEWFASYATCCLQHASGQRPGRRDQGTTVLQYWLNIYALHAADAAGNAARDAEARLAYQLPQHHQDFVLTHVPYGQILLAGRSLATRMPRFRVALLLACDRGRSDEALALLIELATVGHPLALDLLDACSGAPAPGDTGPDATCRLPLAAAQLAWDLGCTARGHKADTHA